MPSTIAVTRVSPREAAARPGVLIRIFWHDQRLASEFLPLDRPARFEVGAEPGCRFALEKVPRFALVEIGGGEATVGFSPHLSGERQGPEGATSIAELIARNEVESEPGGHRLTLERRDVVRLWHGSICFEVLKVRAPPLEPLPFWERLDFTWANVLLAVLALTGAAVLSLAFHEPDLASDLDAARQTQRLVKTLTRIIAEPPPPPKVHRRAEANATPAKDGKAVGAPKPDQPTHPSTSNHAGHATRIS